MIWTACFLAIVSSTLKFIVFIHNLIHSTRIDLITYILSFSWNKYIFTKHNLNRHNWTVLSQAKRKVYLISSFISNIETDRSYTSRRRAVLTDGIWSTLHLHYFCSAFSMPWTTSVDRIKLYLQMTPFQIGLSVGVHSSGVLYASKDMTRWFKFVRSGWDRRKKVKLPLRYPIGCRLAPTYRNFRWWLIILLYCWYYYLESNWHSGQH